MRGKEFLNNFFSDKKVREDKPSYELVPLRSREIPLTTLYGAMNASYRGAEIKEGQPIICPRCGQDDNWRLGGNSKKQVWVCSHGPVENAEWLEDIFSLPTKYAQ